MSIWFLLVVKVFEVECLLVVKLMFFFCMVEMVFLNVLVFKLIICGWIKFIVLVL